MAKILKIKNNLRNSSQKNFERHSVYAENKCTNKNATTSLKLNKRKKTQI